MIKKIREVVREIFSISKNLQQIMPIVESQRREIEELRLLVGNLNAFVKDKLQQDNVKLLADAEFKVFSQFGDDGIIQYLINKIPIINKSFIEFGVQDYKESNTRFLLLNNNWKGLIIDASKQDMEAVKQEEFYWRHHLQVETAFINIENINNIFAKHNFQGELGILSIDIDGNDYWIWEAINVVNPALVIAEYNSVYGADHPITIPYQPDFVRSNAHYSYLYWGASLKALSILADKKGYVLLGSNNAGNNAYFVRKDLANNLYLPTVEEAYVSSKFRESRGVDGKLSFVAEENRLDLIKDCKVYHVLEEKELYIKDLL